MLRLSDGDYFLATSRDKGRTIPVLYTPIKLLAVVDCDHGEERFSSCALGYQRTDRGVHVYLPAGMETIEQDRAYRSMSLVRGFWAERLLSRDGSPRGEPVGTTPEALRHAAAFREALRLANLENGPA